MNSEYLEFLKTKIAIAEDYGFDVQENELNPNYFRDVLVYARAAESEITMPSLFDLEKI